VPFDLLAPVNAERQIEQVIGTSFPWCTRSAAKPKELFGGKRRPCRYDGDGKFDRFFASVRKADRDLNNRQRPLTPSCGGLTPTAKRTVGPARMIVGELDTQTRN